MTTRPGSSASAPTPKPAPPSKPEAAAARGSTRGAARSSSRTPPSRSSARPHRYSGSFRVAASAAMPAASASAQRAATTCARRLDAARNAAPGSSEASTMSVVKRRLFTILSALSLLLCLILVAGLLFGAKDAPSPRWWHRSLGRSFLYQVCGGGWIEHLCPSCTVPHREPGCRRGAGMVPARIERPLLLHGELGPQHHRPR